MYQSRTNNKGNQKNRVQMSTKNLQLGFYTVLFIVTLSGLVSTCNKYPLFPFNMESLDWSNAWLITTILDYYGACLCFCGVVLSSEPSLKVGIAWKVGFCLLGSPVCCIWVLLWLYRGGGSLRLERRLDTRQILS